MHRIQWFDQQIRIGKYPNSNHLAERFEISKRQAQRDIEYLEMSLHAPLQYVAKKRGYCYTDKTFILPHLYMTEEERQVLKFLAFRYRQYHDDNAAVVNRVSHLLDRFTGELEEESSLRLPWFEMDSRLIQNIQLLTYAVQEKLAIHLIYNEFEQESSLRLLPLKLESNYNADYLVAYCEHERKQRSLRLDRIQHVTVTEDQFDHSAHEAQQQERRLIRRPFIARVLLSKQLHGTTWKGYAARELQPFEYEVEFYDEEAFLQHLMTAEWVELQSPQWLRQRLKNRCQQLISRLGG
ncbi:helix-turn-helix transcriptional regulator [Paenibacillus marinisediminis]